MKTTNHVNITCSVKHETHQAILVDDGDQQVWLPKSKIETDAVGDGTIIVRVPEWLAKDRGLI
jgi:hypothetical protein